MRDFKAALDEVADGLGNGDVRRLRSLLDGGTTASKNHTNFLLAGPIGLYALKCVEHKLPPTIVLALTRLLQDMHLLWSKEHHAEFIATLKALVLEAVAMVELYLTVWCRDIKLHLLTQLPDCIAWWGKCSSSACNLLK